MALGQLLSDLGWWDTRTHTGTNSPLASLSIGPKRDKRNSSSPSPACLSASVACCCSGTQRPLTVKVTTDDVMAWAVSSLQQLNWRAIHVKHLSLPFGVFDTPADLGVDASACAMKGVKCGYVRKRIVT